MRNRTVSQGRSWLFKLFKLHEHFIPIVKGQGVLQGADNAAVSCIRNLKKPTGQTARWLDEFDTYNITIL